MKIKVTYEKVFDSDEFYNGSTEDLAELTFEQFKDEIYDELDDDRYLIEAFKFEKIIE
jgi:hypothetical protein